MNTKSATGMTVDEVFRHDHLQSLGFNRREIQVTIANDIDRVLRADPPAPEEVTIRRGPHQGEVWHKRQSACGFVQSGPGTGKTLAGLCALLLEHQRTGERVAISTYTRTLQRQILTDGDLERAQALTGVTVRAAVRVGRANFISRERVESYDALVRKEGATTHSWDEFVGWVRSWTPDTDPMETTFLAWRDNHETLPIIRDEEVAEELFSLTYHAKRADSPDDTAPDRQGSLDLGEDDEDSEPEVDASEDSADLDAMYYTKHAVAAQNADLVITNHTTVLLHGQSGGELLNDIGSIIFDEADRLPDAARSLYTHRLRPDLLLKRCERRTGRKTSRKLREIADQIAAVMQAIGEDCRWRDITPREIATSMPDRFAELSALLKRFRLRGCRAETDGLTSVRKAFRDTGPNLSDIVYVGFSPVRRFPAFCVDPDPQDVSDLLGRLVTRLAPIVPTSEATDAPDMAETETDDDDDDETRDRSGPLFKHAVYVSASLANLASPQPMAGIHYEYGVDPAAVIVSERREPPIFGTMQFVLPDPRVPKPFQERDKNDPSAPVPHSPEWLDYICAVIDHDKSRRMLVLTPSFLEVVALLGRRGIPVENEGADSWSIDHDGVRYHLPMDPGHQIARSITDPAVRVIVTPSLWEGANLVLPGTDGHAKIWMDDLVITRIPLAPQESEFVLERLRAHLMRGGKKARTADEADNIIRNVRYAKALRKLLQGIGRGIRDPHHGTRVWLPDPRIRLPNEGDKRGWLDYVREALDERGEELTLIDKRKKGLAHKSWRRAVPERFQAAIDESAIFLRDGTLLEWSVISQGIYP
jgi:ATP-dependent DNA helicase DinG